MSKAAQIRRERQDQRDAKIEKMLAETGYKGSDNPRDPHRQLIDEWLWQNIQAMTVEHKLKVLEKGESPYKPQKSTGRHGWAVRIMDGNILIERYVGKRVNLMTMIIPLTDWPTTTRASRPNLAYAQRAVLWRTVMTMYRRVFVHSDLTKSEVYVQASLDCDAIRRKIRELVADDWPELTAADQKYEKALRRSEAQRKKPPKPPKPKVIQTPGEAEKIEPPQIKFGATMEDLFGDYLDAPLPPPVKVDTSGLVVVHEVQLQGMEAELAALRAEVETLRMAAETKA